MNTLSLSNQLHTLTLSVHTYNLSIRYTKDADVLWLCDTHAKSMKGIKRFENKYEK